MKSGHICISICVIAASFFGCMALQPLHTIAFAACVAWFVRTIEE